MASLLDHPLVSSRYFYPRPGAPPVVTEVPVDGAVLACASHRPLPYAPLLVHFHGNGEIVADYVPDLARAFESIGLNTFFVEYRGYGGSTGAPALQTMLVDVGRVLESLHGVELGRTFVYGRSVGSIFAIEAAHRFPGLGGLIVESGIADPLERLLLRVRPEELGATLEDLRAEAALHLDHRAKLGAFPGRVLVLHAEHDGLVDRSHAERNAAWSPRSELVLFPRGDHNSILHANLDAILDAVRRFVGES
ncbi:MAG: alpha/beta hydrolase [Polyangiaceae bacterium]